MNRRASPSYRRIALCALIALSLPAAAAFSGIALAQNDPVPPADVPDGAAPADPLPLAPALPDTIDPGKLLTPAQPGLDSAGKSDTGRLEPTNPDRRNVPKPDSAKPDAALTLDAKLTDDGDTLPGGVVWRVFGEKPAPNGKLPLVHQEQGGTVRIALNSGSYYVQAAYGRATSSKHVVVSGDKDRDTLVLNAGGLRLEATLGRDQPLTASQVDFVIFPAGDKAGDEKKPVVPHLRSGQIVKLNAGIYHVVSHYGEANAIVRADIKVVAGKLTEAAMTHEAARVTLKLVAESGGEALANTAWSVTTPVGDNVFESVGAFPDVVLAAGSYTATAKHDGKTHERTFKVEPGANREIEVLAQ